MTNDQEQMDIVDNSGTIEDTERDLLKLLTEWNIL